MLGAVVPGLGDPSLPRLVYTLRSPRNIELKSLKTGVLSTLKELGVFDRVAASKWRRKRLLILCYHGISLEDEHEFDPSLFLSCGQFAQRLRILARVVTTYCRSTTGAEPLVCRRATS